MTIYRGKEADRFESAQFIVLKFYVKIMKVGTVETLEPEKKSKPRTSFSGGGKPSGGSRNNGGGGNNGGNNSNQNDFPETEYKPEKSQVLMWFLLIVVFMTFSGLAAAYIVVSTNGVVEWQPFNLPPQLWVSTILIFASSLTYFRAQKFINQNEQPSAKKWLTATTVLGAVFVSSQVLAWLELVRRGVYWESNPYAGFFYILTAVHAVHVLGGIIALGSIVMRTWNHSVLETDLKRSQTMAQVVGWYWHFMGVLWFGIFLLLGFWK